MKILKANARYIQRVWGKERIMLFAIEDITERSEIAKNRIIATLRNFEACHE